MSLDWKQKHANDSEEAANHTIVQRACLEFANNMGFDFSGLPRYGLLKIANYAAQVARAQALGIDPQLLTLTEDEARSEAYRIAAMAVEQGVPIRFIDEYEGEING